ncbi:hypothetical protein FF1_034703 [Malus domestica]
MSLLQRPQISVDAHEGPGNVKDHMGIAAKSHHLEWSIGIPNGLGRSGSKRKKPEVIIRMLCMHNHLIEDTPGRIYMMGKRRGSLSSI